MIGDSDSIWMISRPLAQCFWISSLAMVMAGKFVGILQGQILLSLNCADFPVHRISMESDLINLPLICLADLQINWPFDVYADAANPR